MKYIILLEKLANQALKVELNGVDCNLTFITRGGRLYLDTFSVDNQNKINGVVCLNKNNLFELAKFKGKLYFEDLQGNEEPYFTGFNDRFVLCYEDD